MQDRIKEYMERRHMLEDTKHVIVGLSGGVDSVCLLMVLQNIIQNEGLDIELSAAHINHQIRGEAALEDERFVRELCGKHNIALNVFRENVPALAKEWGMSEEEAGRKCRYEHFRELCQMKPSTKVAVAHHKDDQAETVLFRLARGTGIKGIIGMQPETEQKGMVVIRPFLCVGRIEIEAYARRERLSFREDLTNKNTEYTRNYIRHEILPRMERVNGQAAGHLCNFSVQAAELYDCVSELADRWFKENLHKEAAEGREYMAVDRHMLTLQHPAIQKEILRKMVMMSGSGTDLSAEHIEQCIKLLENGQGRVMLPHGNLAFISYDRLLIGNTKGRTEEKQEFFLHIEEYSLEEAKYFLKKNYTKMVDYGKIKGTLSIRFRQSGDFICIDKMGHKKSIKKFMIDEKIPRYKRDELPLVCDGEEVVWIVGYRLNPRYYVTEDTKKVCVLYCDRTDRNGEA